MATVRRVIVVGLLGLLVLGVTSCGEDASPPPTPESPAWTELSKEQHAEAERLGVPVTFENDLGMRFVLIPAGRFMMGRLEGDGTGDVPFEATISTAFYMQIAEVTNAEYQRSGLKHGYDGLYASARGSEAEARISALGGARQPVVNVSCLQATEFAAWLTQRSEGRRYRLPTEAEWEYACRAGTTTRYWSGDEEQDLGRVGWYAGNSDRRTHAVGEKAANPWGLYDMHGNAVEWCKDREWRYPLVPGGRGPNHHAPTDKRGLRGGDFDSGPEWAGSARRYAKYKDERHFTYGFRLVSPLPEEGE